MADRAQRKAKWGNFLVPLFLLALIVCLPLQTRLVISNVRTDKTLFALPLDKGERFSLRFTHSVNLSDVTDMLEWTGTELILRESRFTAFGAGIPVPAEGIGKTLVNTPEGFLLSGIDIAQPDNALLIMLQTVPNHRLLYRGREINLLSRAGSGALLRLCVRRVSLLETLLIPQES